MNEENVDFFTEHPKYTEGFTRGVFIDQHHKTVTFLPVGFTKIENGNVPALEVYQTLRKSVQESRDAGIFIPHLPFGRDTHTINFSTEKIGLSSIPYKTLVSVDFTTGIFPSIDNLLERIGSKTIKLGYLPFHSNKFYTSMLKFIDEKRPVGKISFVLKTKIHHGKLEFPQTNITIAEQMTFFGYREKVDMDIFE